MPRLPKQNGFILYNKIQKQVYANFVDREGRKPNRKEYLELQQFSSKKLYHPKYKGRSYKKVSLDEINKEIKFLTSPKEKIKCGSVFNVNPADYLVVDWWDIGNAIQGLPRDVKVRVNAGTEFGISKLDQVFSFIYEIDVETIVERIREFTQNKSADTFFEGIVKVIPGGKQDKNNCSYFIDFVLNDSQGRIDQSSGIETIPEPITEDKDRIVRLKEQDRRRKEISRSKIKEAKTRKRPSLTKADAEEKKKVEQQSARQDIIRALELLREDYKDGIFTKAEYKKEREKLINKFDLGGEI